MTVPHKLLALLIASVGLAAMAPCLAQAHEGAKPVAVISKKDVDAIMTKQWAPSDKAIFKKSSFSAGELRSVLTTFAFQRILANMRNDGAERADDCPTYKLLDIKVVPPQEGDTSIEEIWEVDQCGVRDALPISLSASERAQVLRQPVAHVLPAGFLENAK